MRRLRAWGRALRTREALGCRPGPLWGSAFNGWTGTGERREIAVFRLRPAASPEVRSEVLKNAAVERRKAFPWPLFLGDPGNKLRHQLTKARLSAFRLPLFFSRARSPEPPIHVKRFAGGDDARLKKGAM